MGFFDTLGQAGLAVGTGGASLLGTTDTGRGLVGKFFGGLDRTDNEFRDINQGDFLAPGLGGLRSGFSEFGRRFGGQGFSGFRGDQQGLISQLQAQSRGEGPSLATETLRQGIDRGTAQQQALAATGGVNPALAQRQASQQASGLTQQLAGQGALARLQEQLQAQGLLGQVLGQARGQDQGLFGLRQQGALAGLQGQLGVAGQQQQGRQAFQGARSGRFGQLLGVPTDLEKGLGILQGLGEAGARIGAGGA